MKNIYVQLNKMTKQGSGLVIATVMGTSGSTPQKAGSSALFRNDLLISGTVGGGIVEGKIQVQAGVCSKTGESAFLKFTLDNDISRKEEAICGGTIFILLDADPMRHLPVYKEMELTLAGGQPGVLVTIVRLRKEPDVRIDRYWTGGSSALTLPEDIFRKIEAEIKDIISIPGSAGFRQLELAITEEESSAMCFLEPVFPLPRLVIAGAGHIGRALSHLGKMLDFEVTVIDDRREFANPENLPDADHLIVKDIGDAMSEIRKDPDTYIVIVTRGHNDDAKALKPCINTVAGYIGMIGSKGKVGKMREEFIRNGWASGDDWQKIHAPIGLDIGSKTVEEIAVSIAAQLIYVRSGGGG